MLNTRKGFYCKYLNSNVYLQGFKALSFTKSNTYVGIMK